MYTQANRRLLALPTACLSFTVCSPRSVLPWSSHQAVLTDSLLCIGNFSSLVNIFNGSCRLTSIISEDKNLFCFHHCTSHQMSSEILDLVEGKKKKLDRAGRRMHYVFMWARSQHIHAFVSTCLQRKLSRYLTANQTSVFSKCRLLLLLLELRKPSSHWSIQRNYCCDFFETLAV